MSLDAALSLLSYACVAVFVLAVVLRALKIAGLPTHVRWELYPVAHEKGKAHYGGSYFEELDWWTKPRESSMLGELKVMVPEILLLSGVRHRNQSHWLRTFPFHFGLYLLIGATVLLIAGGLATGVFGAADGLGDFLNRLTAGIAYVGFGLALLGSLGLFFRRVLNEDYREYTKPLDYLNLLLFIAAFAVALLAQATADPDFARMRGFFAGLLSFGAHTPETGLGLGGLQAAQVVLLSVLAAYVPLTHMSHFFTKYFMYHDIRWNDEPMKAGGKLEKKMTAILGMKPTWSAPHIQGDGVKTWVDVATSSGLPEETKKGGES